MIQTMENFLRPYVERRPAGWSQHLALAEFAANNAVNVATGYTPFFLNSGDHPIVPSILLHGGGVSSRVEAVQTMVDRMRTALEEAQANLSVAANRAKAYANASRREEKYEVGDEVVLATRHVVPPPNGAARPGSVDTGDSVKPKRILQITSDNQNICPLHCGRWAH